MSGPLITATARADHIRVEVYRACTVEYSDDRETWHPVPADRWQSEDGVSVYLDYGAPLGLPRAYRARVAEELVTARRITDDWWRPTTSG